MRIVLRSTLLEQNLGATHEECSGNKNEHFITFAICQVRRPIFCALNLP